MSKKEFQNQIYDKAINQLNTQAFSHRALMESPAVRRHALAIRKAIKAVREALANGNFETLLNLEIEMQQLEMTMYARDPGMIASIERTRDDLEAGMLDYRQLIDNPKAYRERGYRKSDRTGTNRRFPFDTMRKALRGQAARVGNFAKNPMLSPEEKEFHRLRVAILKRAEMLYEELQTAALDGETGHCK